MGYLEGAPPFTLHQSEVATTGWPHLTSSLSDFIRTMLDATDSYAKLENLLQSEINPVFRDGNISSVFGPGCRQTTIMHTTASAPPTYIEKNDYQYSDLICLAQCGCAIVACGGTTRYFYLQFKCVFLSRFLCRF